MIEEILTRLISHSPHISLLVAVVGALRLTIPVLMQGLRIISNQTATKADDAALDAIEQSPSYRKALALMEWLTSIKLTR